jgi:transcriptional regulator with XRE-family HTH domain
VPAPRELNPTASPLSLFGAELRRCRNALGLSQEQLGGRIAFSPSLVGSIERARRRPSPAFAQRCEEVLNLNGELLRLLPLISKETAPSWFRPWLEIEEGAHTLKTWQPLLLPGLLQTEEYARALCRGEPGATEEQAEEMVAARMERKAIFQRDDPPMFWALLDETAFIRPIGGADVIRGQLEHLLAAVGPRVTVQVVPLSAGTPTGLLGGFVIAQRTDCPDTVYVDSVISGQVTDGPDDVKAIHARYDTIRAQAHPQFVSIELIREAIKRWT